MLTVDESSKQSAAQPRVAIVHDWLVSQGGAERHVLQICETFPGAPLFVSIYRPEDTLRGFADVDIRGSWIQKLPFFGKNHRLAIPFRYLHWGLIIRRRLKDYDIILSSSGSEAKVIRARKGQLIINTCFSPTHYYWSHFDEYLRNPGLGFFNGPAKVLLRLAIWPLRRLDLYAAARPHRMLANSNTVRKRIERYYRRAADVIFPPVDDLGLSEQDLRRERRGLVAIGRQVPYKRIDLAIEAANLLQLPLKVIGSGPEHARLRRLAGPTVEMLGELDEQDKIDILTRSQAIIFPNEDDFGITPVEAMMAGCPAVAFKAGGALDSVASDSAGVYFDEQTPEAVAEAVERLLADPPSPAAARAWAMRFHRDSFRRQLRDYVEDAWQAFNRV